MFHINQACTGLLRKNIGRCSFVFVFFFYFCTDLDSLVRTTRHFPSTIDPCTCLEGTVQYLFLRLIDSTWEKMIWLRQNFVRVARTICFGEVAISIVIHCFHSL